MRRVVATLVAVCALAAAASPVQAVQPFAVAVGDAHSSLYLVVLRDAPLATYDGAISGYAATVPAEGTRFKAGRTSVRAYRALLQSRQDDVLSSIGDARVVYSYTTVLNGFAAMLTEAQVKQLSMMPQVLTIEQSTKQHVDGASPAAASVDLTPRGRWSQPGGSANAGRGVVVAMIDSGIWPENPSFAGVPIDAQAMAARYPGFTGACQPAERWPSGTCGAKVLSARYFVAGFGAANLSNSEYLSARDAHGHGSQTAGIAAGNPGVAVNIDGQDFGRIAGSAPGAAVAVYKACWLAPDPADDGCTTADTVMAIDQAVSDGVDVLSYSISGGDTSTDVVELAFLHASGAGVFVAASAGNSGPRPGSVTHPSPWVTTVGATDALARRGDVVLGDGKRLAGMMIPGRAVRDRSLVYAADARVAGVSRREAAFCLPNSLDTGVVAGAVVLCDRGVNARLDKSTTVQQSGGSAMVLANTGRGAAAADLHAVPTVHLDLASGDAAKAYLDRSPAPTASLVPRPSSTRAPEVADFSGRGPVTSTDGGVLKPDITAPGVSVLSAVAPPASFGRLWDFGSGTSMATADIAGLAAVIRSQQRRWSPAEVKSALSTTSVPLSTAGSPLDRGAGGANVRRMSDPGLVYDVTMSDWLGYLRGLGLSYQGSQAGSVSAQDLNLPAILVNNLVGDSAVTRTVTNVSTRTERYVARVDGVRGVDVSVSPSSVRLAPGDSATYTVSFSARRFARYERYVTGSLTWRGSLGHRVTSPVVVRAEYLRAPQEVSGTTKERTIDVTAKAGVTGTLDATVQGLVGATPTDLTLEPGPFDPASPGVSSSASVQTYAVPDDTGVARFELQTVNDDGDDLDLYVYRDSRLVARTTSAAGDEELTMMRPPAGSYDVYAVSVSSSDGGSSRAQLTGWVVTGDSGQEATTAPDPLTVTGDRDVDITVRFGRLDPTQRWFGYLEYADSSRRTYLTVG
jgi:hypothetical protein